MMPPGWGWTTSTRVTSAVSPAEAVSWWRAGAACTSLPCSFVNQAPTPTATTTNKISTTIQPALDDFFTTGGAGRVGSIFVVTAENLPRIP